MLLHAGGIPQQHDPDECSLVACATVHMQAQQDCSAAIWPRPLDSQEIDDSPARPPAAMFTAKKRQKSVLELYLGNRFLMVSCSQPGVKEAQHH